MTIIKPTINLNGTSPTVLLQEHIDAHSALCAAISLVSAAGPNGRDYQTAAAGTFFIAQSQHAIRLNKLNDVLAELEAIALHISEQV